MAIKVTERIVNKVDFVKFVKIETVIAITMRKGRTETKKMTELALFTNRMRIPKNV